jgi:hypothetical protein
LSEYLNSTGHPYSTFLIDINKNDLVYIDGISDNDLKEDCKEGLDLTTKRIFALYGQRNCKSDINPVEVFMIDKDLWESNDEQLKELLIFHEVCHLLEKRGYYENLNIKLSDYESRIGLKLNEIANRIDDMSGGWGQDDNHNQLFGAILFHFFNQYDSENSHQLLAQSMIKNFDNDYTKTFEEII